MARLSTDGTKILDNYDRFTGVPFNATKVTTWWDGTAMNDSKVDNAIYFKNTTSLGGGYSKRDFEGEIDIRWFGAKGDGTTNDRTIVLNAINSIPEYSTLTFDKGIYIFNASTTINNKNINIKGNNATFKLTGGGFNLLIFNSSINFDGIIFDGNNNCRSLLQYHGSSNINIKNCTFKNVAKSDAVSTFTGIYLLGCKNVNINQCYFENFNSTSHDAAVNPIHIIPYQGASSVNINISKCIFKNINDYDGSDAIHLNQQQGEVDDPSMNILIDACTFIDCARRAVKAQTEDVTISNCTSYDSFGVTDRRFCIFEIFGSNSKIINNTILNNYCDDVFKVYNEASIKISNVLISGNIIRVLNSYRIILFNSTTSTTPDMQFENIAISNNIVAQPSVLSTSCVGVISGTITGFIISDNIFTTGIIQNPTSLIKDVKINNNIIKPVVIATGAMHGIHLQNANSVEISNNYISKLRYGIFLAACIDIGIYNNKLQENIVRGLSAGSTVSNLKLFKNSLIGTVGTYDLDVASCIDVKYTDNIAAKKNLPTARPTTEIPIGYILYESGFPISYDGSTWVSLGKITSGTTANRPTLTSTDIGKVYFDTSIQQYITWNGTIWVVGTIIDATTTVYTKSTLNTQYPDARIGTRVVQDAASGGGKTYLKKDNSTTGNWSVFSTAQLA